MKQQIVWSVIGLAAWTAAMAPPAQAGPLASRVLVVYVSGDADSTSIATAYASKRGIPSSNLCAVTLANPAAALLAGADWTNLKTALRGCLDSAGRQNILYMVLAWFRPYVVDPGGGFRYYSLDSYLADIWDQYTTQDFKPAPSRTHPYYADFQSQGDYYIPFQSFAAFRAQSRGPLIYSVWRLDGATTAIAGGLVDKAMAAEAAGGPISQTIGVKANACVDMLLDPAIYLDRGLRQGDWDLLRAGQFLTGSTLFNLITDSTTQNFGTPPAPNCPNAGLYAGWYNYATYNDAFTWDTGAIGWDLNSASASDPRSGPTWVPNALTRGITVTAGSVAEPYLEGLPRPSGLIRNLLEGANAGDAFLRNTRWLKWQLLNVGDPLYQPFGAGSPQPALNSLWFNVRDIVGGIQQAQGRVTLAGPAPMGGVTLNLSAASPAVIVPPAVTVAAGGTTATFLVTSSAVTSNTDAGITASNGTLSLANSVTIYPLLASLGYSANPVRGGQSTTGTVYLNASAPFGGASVQLSSDQPAVASVPASVFVAAGLGRVNFTVNSAAVTAPTTVNVTATYAGATTTLALTVTP